MSELEFMDTTPRWLAARYAKWAECQRTTWEQTRIISFWIVKTVDSIGSPRDLMPFDWDEKPPAMEFDKESAARFDSEADEFLKKVNPKAYEAYMQGKQHANNS